MGGEEWVVAWWFEMSAVLSWCLINNNKFLTFHVRRNPLLVFDIYIKIWGTVFTFFKCTIQQLIIHCCCCSVTKLCPSLCNPMDCSTPGFPVLHYLPEFAQIHVHWVSDASQLSHPLLPPCLPALNLSQHQGLFQWVGSSNQVAKVWELQLQHQSFQWIFMVYFLLYTKFFSSPLIPENFRHPKKMYSSASILPKFLSNPFLPLSLWICLFWTFHINGIVKQGSFLFCFFDPGQCFQGLSMLWCILIPHSFKKKKR